jgi:hypothetical protein
MAASSSTPTWCASGKIRSDLTLSRSWVKRAPETHIMLVTLKAFDNAVIQAAMEWLCERWNQKADQMPCEDGMYTLLSCNMQLPFTNPPSTCPTRRAPRRTNCGHTDIPP